MGTGGQTVPKGSEVLQGGRGLLGEMAVISLGMECVFALLGIRNGIFLNVFRKGGVIDAV